MSFRVLLVEDDPEIAKFVAQGLREEGLHVEHVADGYAAAQALSASKWDLAILDWWLPGITGLALVQRLRQAEDSTPVLFLTARDAVAQRVEGLVAGADDYLCKPFDFTELVARVHALLRRPPISKPQEWRFADVVVDVRTGSAERDGRSLGLTAREHALLAFFLRHPREVLSRTRLYENVWNQKFDGLSNTLEVHIMELRRKLETFGPRLIQTVRGRGYRLEEFAEPEAE